MHNALVFSAFLAASKYIYKPIVYATPPHSFLSGSLPPTNTGFMMHRKASSAYLKARSDMNL